MAKANDDLLSLITSELPEDDELPTLMSGQDNDEEETDDIEETDEQDEQEEPEDEPETEPEEDEEPEVEEKPEPPKKSDKKPVSKEEAKIVALKRQNKALEEENRRFKQVEAQKAQAQKVTDLQSQYESQGYDSDTAKIYAERDVRLANVEERIAQADFREQYADVIAQYPEAKNNIAKVMENVSKTGLSVEQICKAMFEGTESPADRRAREAAQGKLQRRDDSADYTTAKAARSATAPSVTVLSQRDQALKSQFERTFMGGEKLSNKEFAQMKKDYGF